MFSVSAVYVDTRMFSSGLDSFDADPRGPSSLAGALPPHETSVVILKTPGRQREWTSTLPAHLSFRTLTRRTSDLSGRVVSVPSIVSPLTINSQMP